MIPRDISSHLENLSGKYPVVTITGPRQSGKTTLARHLYKDKAYVNLEHIETREFAQADPIGFLRKYPDGAVIDEIQRVPDLLSYIQVIADEKQTNGLFILTGSSQFRLMASITQSLAGRSALLHLLPFSVHELAKGYPDLDAFDFMHRGFYPRIYDRDLDPTQALGDYFETYVERDIRQLSQIQNMSLFQKFVRLCAGRIGQLLNTSNLANDAGISHTTAREWLSLLQASYVLFLLESYHSNIKKRLVKSPKLYFYDVGLASFLMGIENRSHLEIHPLRGNLFENLVVVEVLKYRLNIGRKPNIFFYRDSNGNELDLLYTVAQHIIPIEVKSGETITGDYFKGFKALNKVIREFPYGRALIYAGDRNDVQSGVRILNIHRIHDFLLQREEKKGP
ncbi:ATP-binding protein [Thermodesulfobacteriota bacterium]